jgi:hypothetical protein
MLRSTMPIYAVGSAKPAHYADSMYEFITFYLSFESHEQTFSVQ